MKLQKMVVTGDFSDSPPMETNKRLVNGTHFIRNQFAHKVFRRNFCKEEVHEEEKLKIRSKAVGFPSFELDDEFFKEGENDGIGDRYLKPWVIPEPEVVIVPRNREDECLILASDGLWDVMTNGEACEKAGRRILLWYKRNDTSTPSWRGEGVDPACQAAAEYLSKLALQKGSKDNITVIVVDLNEERKFKNTT